MRAIRSGEERVSKMMTIDEIVESLPEETPGSVVDAIMKAYEVLQTHERPVCSISGGSDSDVMLDLMFRVDQEKKIRYVWFDTGVEYRATKSHLKYLEDRYGIVIEPIKAIKPIPTCTRQYGQPFVSKFVSDMVSRLQAHGFRFEDEPYEVLRERYHDCDSALKWWCNKWQNSDHESRFDIAWRRGLKEFMVANPPMFPISAKCCDYAKKKVAKQNTKLNGYDLEIIGVRKSEGGTRASVYRDCFSHVDGKVDHFRPLFWMTNEDKEQYEKLFDIRHSDCYGVYGLKRTGCVGCPFGYDCFDEVKVAEQHEPNLAKAVNSIFAESYEYTKKYEEFKQRMKREKEDEVRYDLQADA